MKQYKNVEQCFADKSTKAFNQGLAQYLETINSKANWVSRDKESVKEWLKVCGYLKWLNNA